MRTRLLLLLVALLAACPLRAQEWRSGGPYGGSFQSFLFHPTREGLVFASGLDGLFRSTDDGVHWSRLDVPGGEFTVRVHPKAPDLLLAASSTHGVYASTDSGQNWELRYRYEFTTDAFYDMEFDPSDPAILYAVSYYNGVYRSTDAGVTWAQKNKGLQLKPVRDCCVDIPQLEIDPRNGRILYALLPSRAVYRSDNAGESWKHASPGLTFTREVHALVIDPRNTLTLYAGGANGIFRTLNAGQRWNARNCGCYIWNFAVNPRNAAEIYGVGEGAVKSTNGGNTWEWFTPHPFLSGILLGVAVDPKHPEHVLVGGFGGGVFRSTDSGRNWETVNDTLDALNVVRLVSAPGRLLAVGGQKAFESTDGGNTWDLFLKGQGSIFWVSDIAVHPRDPDLIVAAGYRKTPGALTISHDGGKTWETRSPYAGVNYGCSRCVALDPSDRNVLYLAPFAKKNDQVTQLGVAKSTDSGKTWTILNSGLTSLDVWMLAVSPHDPAFVFAGTGTGSLFRSINAGKSWTPVGEALDHTSIRDIAFDPGDPKAVYLSTYTSIFKSTDAGATWKRSSDGLPPRAWLNFVDVDWRNHGTIYAAGEAGIFESADAGATWLPYPSGNPGEFAVWSLLVDPQHPDRVFAGTDRGVFVLTPP